MAKGDGADLNVDRFNAFTDGVIVISMTLLVLNIDLPDLERSADDATLATQLLNLWPSYMGYVISFVVIAQYWMGYTGRFGDLRRIDKGFAWLNILFLLCIGLVPFSTSLLSAHDGFVATTVYSAVMMAISAMMIAMWLYANAKELHGTRLPDRQVWSSLGPWVKIIVVFGLSIIVSRFAPESGRLIYLLLFLPDRLFSIRA